MQTIRLTGRKSRLSLLQIDRVRRKIEACFPGIRVEVVALDARGDQLQDIPLQTVEGTDFFTKEISQQLEQRRADIAVHSLKDMSAAHFFGSHHFAVTERDDTRDIAVFRADVLHKIAQGKSLVMGTCSPRREDMAMDFLRRAVPSANGQVSITVSPIRGNVETRLRKLDEGLYDGTILATAGLNRLLESAEDAPMVRALLKDKKTMLLPLVECVPAPCQGAIVAECISGNAWAKQVLSAINNQALMNTCVREKRLAMAYGTGCDQRFGVSHLPFANHSFLVAQGRDGRNRPLYYWQGLPEHPRRIRKMFSSTDHMSEFFRYDYLDRSQELKTGVVYIANHKALTGGHGISLGDGLRVWAAGTRTWMELARRNIWVEGSADALGLESLKPVFRMPVIDIDPGQVTVLTHEEATEGWAAKGWKSISTYRLLHRKETPLAESVRSSDFIFWTSYGQFEQYRSFLTPGVVHACPYGETAEKLRAAGIDPIVFPTIQSFQSWRQSITI
jgi:hydroxymethylbilane synthase